MGSANLLPSGGGIAAGIVSATWQLGRVSIGGDRLRIWSPIGSRTVDVWRDTR
jgi:hypothetical protein